MLAIVAAASALPDTEVTNADLERRMETTADFIRLRTGVITRRFVRQDECTSDLMLVAVERALRRAAIEPDAIDMMIVSTLSPDHHDPSQACFLHGRMPGMRPIPIFDIRAQCSGFLYGLYIAESLLATGRADTILVVCGEVLSKRVEGSLADRNLAVLVGDGAAAAVVRKSAGGNGLMDLRILADGAQSGLLVTAAPGSAGVQFMSQDDLAAGRHRFAMDGPALFAHATRTMAAEIEDLLQRNGLGMPDIARVYCHQPNVRMLEHIAARFPGHEHKFLINGDTYGNMGSASLPVLWAEHAAAEVVGSLSLLVAYGAGATWGAGLYRH